MGLASVVAAWATLSSLESFQDLPTGKGASLTKGQAMFDPGETVVHTQEIGKYDLDMRNELKLHSRKLDTLNENIALLTKNMKSYFAPGGHIYNRGVKVTG